jgi:nicotinamide-nucleotide amidase
MEVCVTLQKEELSTQNLCGLVADLLLKHGWMLATAESCTGGLIAAACTDLAGGSSPIPTPQKPSCSV